MPCAHSGRLAVTTETITPPAKSVGSRGAVQGVSELFRGGKRHFVVAVDLGDRGAVEAAAHAGVPEPGRHRLVVGESEERGGQVAVHRAAQPDGFEHGPVRFGDQPLEAVPG